MNTATQEQEAPMTQADGAKNAGLVPRRYFTQEKIADIARTCHEANRAVCIVNGDFSQTLWDDAPTWQKDSAIDGVRYHLDNPHADPRELHDRWMEIKLRQGWKHGATKNADAKEHPCLLPYSALPENERVKDQVFSAIVKAYVASWKQSQMQHGTGGVLGGPLVQPCAEPLR